MTLTDVGVDSGMSVGVGGVTGTPVAIGSTVGDGLGAMVGTAMVDVGCGVGLVTTEVSEHANPPKTIIKTLTVKNRFRPILEKYNNFRRGLRRSGRASQRRRL